MQLGSLTIQGIFPKRQKALAINLAAVIEGELLSHDDIQNVMQRPEFAARLKDKIKDGFSEFLSKRLGGLNPMIAMFLDGPMLDKITGLLDTELDRIVPGLLETASSELETPWIFGKSSRTRSKACPWSAWKRCS